MKSNAEKTSERAAIVRRARAAALLALPFQVTCVVLGPALYSLGFDVTVLLTVLLVPVFWVPMAVELVFRTSLPRPLQLSYLVFIAAGPFIGTALHVYWYVPPWDLLVHFWSGIMLSWLGMLLARRAEEQMDTALPRWFSVSAILFTAMAFAAAWEICEFISDRLIGTHAQLGQTDSMTDLISGTLGGVAAIVLLLLTRRPRSLAPASLLSPR
jgi:hypothetical protein